MFKKFMEIYYLAPFGNDGRGTRIYLFPFVGVVVTILGAMAINYIIYGNI